MPVAVDTKFVHCTLINIISVPIKLRLFLSPFDTSHRIQLSLSDSHWSIEPISQDSSFIICRVMAKTYPALFYCLSRVNAGVSTIYPAVNNKMLTDGKYWQRQEVTPGGTEWVLANQRVASRRTNQWDARIGWAEISSWHGVVVTNVWAACSQDLNLNILSLSIKLENLNSSWF